MLAALDSLVDNDIGGRPIVALKQVCGLYVRVGSAGGDDVAPLFDALMVTLAMDIDDDCLRVLGPELRGLPGMLPAFTAAVASRFEELSQRRPLVAAELSAHEACAPEQALAAPPLAPLDRRAERRDPVADAQHPLSLARKASPAELMEIAGLPVLPETMTNVLLSRGHMPAVIAALGNPGAAFARSSLTMLAELAPGDRDLRNALMGRSDIPDSVVDRLLPVIGREARAKLIMSGTDAEAEPARLALAKAEDDLTAGSGRGQPSAPIDVLRAMVEDGRMSLDAAVASLARDGRLPELAAFATARLGIGYVAAYAMIAGRLDHPAAILVKAMDGGREALDAVLELRRRCRFREARDVNSAISAHARQDAEEARLLARLVDRNIAASGEAEESASIVPFKLALAS
jgi:hypothetical protein